MPILTIFSLYKKDVRGYSLHGRVGVKKQVINSYESCLRGRKRAPTDSVSDRNTCVVVG